MGRTEPTVVKQPAAFRRDARAKRARAVINKVIPALLSTHPRARRGIERSELIVDPPRLTQVKACEHQGGKFGEDFIGIDGAEKGGWKASGARRDGGRQKANSGLHDESARDDDDNIENSSRSRVKKESGGNICGPRITLCIADTLTAAHALLESESPTQLRGQSKQQRSQGEKRVIATARAPNVNGGCARPPKIGILNMASPLSPGGGFLNGATSQEESLCMRTTLLPSLRDEYYRLPELGVVYTPDVLVFQSATSASSSSPSPSEKGGETGVGGSGDAEEHHDEKDILSKNDRWYVDVASAAMLRLPETEITEHGGCYANPADRELVVRKMRAVLRVFAAKGCTRVVLGAWGCGAYGNPVAEIAKAWRRVLCVEAERNGDKAESSRPNAQDARGENPGNVKSKRRKAEDKNSRKRANPEPWGTYIEKVVFAVKDANLATSFARAFGEDIMPLPTSLSGGGGDDGSLSSTGGDDAYSENPVEVARISELREKIVQLEAQIEQTRSPQMQAGLGSVLANLKKQLPVEGVEDEDHEDEDDADNDDEGSEAPEQEFSSEEDETAP